MYAVWYFHKIKSYLIFVCDEGCALCVLGNKVKHSALWVVNITV